MVRRLLDDNPMLAKDVNDDKDYNYRVINNYIGSNQKRWSYNIDQLWLMLQDSYVVITNWYNNQQWYHLIGLCITLKKLKEKKTKGKDYANLIFDIYKLYIKEPKSKFTRQLKMIIGKEVRSPCCRPANTTRGAAALAVRIYEKCEEVKQGIPYRISPAIFIPSILYYTYRNKPLLP